MASKIEETWNSISPERRKEFDYILAEVSNKIKSNEQFEYGKVYPIEITKAFDSESPKQWIYIKIIFAVHKRKGIIEGMGEQEYDMIQRMFEAIEIYDENNYYPSWIDHVSRIESESKENGESQMFYENNIFKSEDNSKISTVVGEETKSEEMNKFTDLMDKMEGKKDA